MKHLYNYWIIYKLNILTKLHIQMLNIKVVRDIPQKVPIFRRAHLAYHSTFTSVPRENIKAAKPSKKRFPLDVFPMFAGFVHIHRLNQPPNQFRAQQLNQPIDSKQIWRSLNFEEIKICFFCVWRFQQLPWNWKYTQAAINATYVSKVPNPFWHPFIPIGSKGSLIMVDYNPNI